MPCDSLAPCSQTWLGVFVQERFLAEQHGANVCGLDGETTPKSSSCPKLTHQTPLVGTALPEP